MDWSNVAKELVLVIDPLVLWTQFNIVRERLSNQKRKKVKLFSFFFFFIFQCANLKYGRKPIITGNYQTSSQRYFQSKI